MASSEIAEPELGRPADDPNWPLQEHPAMTTQDTSSSPIELSDLSPSQAIPAPASTDDRAAGETIKGQNVESSPRLGPPVPPVGGEPDASISSSLDTNQAIPQSSTTVDKPEAFTINVPSPLTREVTRPAIEPATDKPSLVPKEAGVEGPVLYITLLLTTGARHPFRLDQKYLRKRNVEVEGNNPINMSLYKLKELILRDWREEWEAKPSSPESIRLISMGKLLTDKSKLAELGFKDGAGPAIVHMTIKPQEIVDEEEANKNVRERDGTEKTPGCRCTIM